MARFEKGKALNPNDIIAYQEEGIVSMELLHNESGSITLFRFLVKVNSSVHTLPHSMLLYKQ